MVVFWDVDTQEDFMNKNGALPVPDAEKIKLALKSLTQYALKNDILILGSVDRHFDDDDELHIFPPHCMNNTLGQKKISETSSKNMIYIESKVGMFGKYVDYTNDEIQIYTRSYNHILFEKQNINVFTNRNVIKFINKLRVSSVIVYGVATEYCVKEAVLGLLKIGIKVYIVTDAIKGINEHDAKVALNEMMEKGAQRIFVDDVLNME